ncbi:MAG: SMC family ATPase [Gemmatimonadota bacterium]
MQIERIHLVNFRQHEDTDLRFGPGLTGIVGPNGAGKTTLLEGIAWAIYGAPAARGTRESIRRRGAPPRAPVRVELEFVLGAHRYRIVRTLSTAELYQDSDPAPIANSIATVTEQTSRMLGMRQEEFFNTYFTGQKELAVMAAMKPAERAQFLSRVLGYERLKLAQDRLRELRAGLRARLQVLQSTLPDPAQLDEEEARARARLQVSRDAETAGIAACAEGDRRVADVSPRWEAMQRLRETMATLEGEFRVAEHRVQSAREKFQTLDRQLIEASEARTRLEELRPRLAPLESLRAERAALDAQADATASRRTAAAQLEEVRARLQALETRLARLPLAETLEEARHRVEEQRAALATTLSHLDERRTGWVRDTQDAKTKRETLVDQYKDLREQHQRIVKAGQEGACPTCARPLGDEYEKVLDVLDRQLQDVLFNGNFYKQRIEQLATEPPELREMNSRRAQLERDGAESSASLVRLQAQLQEGPALFQERERLLARVAEMESILASTAGTYDQARHREVRQLVTDLEPLAAQGERFRVVAERAESLIREAESAEKALSDREVAARNLQHQMAELGYTEWAYTQTRAEHDSAQQSKREAEMLLVRARAEGAAAGEGLLAVERRRTERATQEAEARKSAQELAIHNELDRAFTDLRTDLNTQLRPDLSELASGFLRDLTNGRYTEMELDEDYVATLLDGGEVKPVISGGEEDVANLALRLAISQMIAERAGQPLSLLVLDEIFGSLDEERRASVLDLLRSLADRFPQVILITHIESVRDGFDRVIRVDYDGERGTARVREEAVGGTDGLAA